MKSTEATPEQLKEIETFAGLYLEKKEIALVMELEDKNSLNDVDNPVGKAFAKGRIKRKASFMESVVKLSDQLSSPAQAIELKASEKVLINDKKPI